MASSGTITSAKFGGGFYIDIKWATQSQSTSSNSSSVKVDVVFRAASGYSTSTTATKNGSVTINGQTHNFTFTAGLSSGGSKTVKSVTQTISHNSDGTKSVALSTTLGINLTLSGTYVGNASASGTAALDKINLTTSPGVGRMSAPTTSTISEKATSIAVSWTGFTNGTNNTVNKYEIQYSKNGGAWTGLTTVNTTATSGSYTHTITAAEGQTYKYRVRGCGSSGTWTGYTSESGTVTTNTFTAGWFTGHSNDVGYSTTSFSLNFTGGKNSDGTGVNYMCYSDNVTVHNQTNVTNTSSQTITIWRSGTTPTGPYIKFDDLKNLYKNSNYNGRLHVGLRTGNGRGYKYSGGSIGVDLRVNPVAPSSVTISQTVSSTTAYRKHNGLNANYYVPDGSKTISFSWSAGSSPLGSSFFYRLYVIRNGSASVIADNVSSSTTSYTYTPPKVSSGTQTLAFGVHTVTSYGYSSHKDSGSVTLHSYSPPTITTSLSERTATGAKVKYKVTTSSSLTTGATGSWTCTGATPATGTISSTAEQTITFTGLAAASSYSVNFTYNDNSGWTSNATKTQSISQQIPVMEIMPSGVGINGGTTTATVKLDVNGETRASQGFVATNPGDNGTSSVSLNFHNNRSRIRYGGNGTGATNGFEIQGPGDGTKLRINDAGDLFVARNLDLSTGKKICSSEAIGFFSDNASSAQQIRVGSLLVSSAYADNTLIPSAGIYSRGEIHSGGLVKAGAKCRIGTGSTDVYFNNTTANKYLQITDGGTLSFSGDNVVLRSHVAQGATASRIVERDSAADITCRLVRTTYGNEDRLTGGIVFRVSTSDNYLRVCQSASAARGWLGAFSTGGGDVSGTIRSTVSDGKALRTSASSMVLQWNNENSTSAQVSFHKGSTGMAHANCHNQPNLKLAWEGGGLHLAADKTSAGGAFILRGSAWGNYGDITYAKAYAMSDSRYKENIKAFDMKSDSKAIAMKLDGEEEHSALGIIRAAGAYSYTYIQDRGMDTLIERPRSFGLMAEELPPELIKTSEKASDAILVDQYGVSVVAWQGVRELSEEVYDNSYHIMELESTIEKLKKENLEYKGKLYIIENALAKAGILGEMTA